MSDEFIFKSPAAAVVDNGSGMFQPPAVDAFEEPLLGLTMPRVLGLVVENGFEDPLLGLQPRGFEDPLLGRNAPPSVSFDDAGNAFLVPQGFEDPLLG